MVEIARRERPDLTFADGALPQLPFASTRFIATVYWYSIITTPPALLATVFAELVRILGENGIALVAFQSGDGSAIERPNGFGTTSTSRCFGTMFSSLRQASNGRGSISLMSSNENRSVPTSTPRRRSSVSAADLIAPDASPTGGIAQAGLHHGRAFQTGRPGNDVVELRGSRPVPPGNQVLERSLNFLSPALSRAVAA
jgi:hypothetical protein